MVIRNLTRDVDLISRPVMANRSWTRLLGLMGRESLRDGEGLVLEPANGIHMFFMRFAIDAVFVDRDWKVLHIAHDLKPWRVTRLVRRSKRVIEMSAGRCQATGTQPGDQLGMV